MPACFGRHAGAGAPAGSAPAAQAQRVRQHTNLEGFLQVREYRWLAVQLTVITSAACGIQSATQGYEPGPSPCGMPEPADTIVYDTTEVTPIPTPYHAPHPRYPPELRTRGVQGRVDLALIVDAHGRPEPRSIRIVSTPDNDLAQLAIAALRSSRFRPGCRGGHAVRVRVATWYTFTMRRP